MFRVYDILYLQRRLLNEMEHITCPFDFQPCLMNNLKYRHVIFYTVANLVKPIRKPRVEVEEAREQRHPKKKKKNITIFETNQTKSYTFSLSFFPSYIKRFSVESHCMIYCPSY